MKTTNNDDIYPNFDFYERQYIAHDPPETRQIPSYHSTVSKHLPSRNKVPNPHFLDEDRYD